MRSGQKNLDDIQRIRAAMESGSPVVTRAQQELIEKYAALLGEDRRGIIQDIEEDAGKTGKLPADVFRSIDSCLNSLGQRAKRQELSNKVIQERESDRLLQVEAIREHATQAHWRPGWVRQHYCGKRQAGNAGAGGKLHGDRGQG